MKRRTLLLLLGGAPDITPGAFSFVDQTDVALNATITSAAIVVSGINSPSPISITGGTYSKNGGAYTAVAGTVNNGDSITVRQTSSSSVLTAVNTVLTIGGVSDTFTSTTTDLVWTMDATLADDLVNCCSVAPTVSRTDILNASIDSAGLLRFAAIDQLLRTHDPVTHAVLGFVHKPARICVVLRNRDLTNAVWTKGATMTVAKDQTGADGSANGASSMTGGAVSATNTVLQAITLASSARSQACLVKRLVGTGTLEMTMDGGSTYTNVTSTVDGAQNGPNGFRIVTIPTQTLANPSVGFRIGTSGDKFAVDYFMNLDGNYLSVDPWFATAGATVSRGADGVTVPVSSITGLTNAVTIYGEAYGVPSGNNHRLAAIGVNASNSLDIYQRSTPLEICETVNGGATQASITRSPAWASTTLRKLAGAAAANDFGYSSGGTAGTRDTSGTMPTLTTLYIGAGTAGSGQRETPILRMNVYGVSKNDAALNALTA